jgi:hypothetical protein
MSMAGSTLSSLYSSFNDETFADYDAVEELVAESPDALIRECEASLRGAAEDAVAVGTVEEADTADETDPFASSVASVTDVDDHSARRSSFVDDHSAWRSSQGDENQEREWERPVAAADGRYRKPMVVSSSGGGVTEVTYM